MDEIYNLRERVRKASKHIDSEERKGEPEELDILNPKVYRNKPIEEIARIISANVEEKKY